MTLPTTICRCLGQRCAAERVGCLRFNDDGDPMRTPWAATLRPVNQPVDQPCPERLTDQEIDP